MKTDNELIAEKRRHYHRVHQWLHRNYGKASKCEDDKCDGDCNKFEWALLNGKVFHWFIFALSIVIIAVLMRAQSILKDLPQSILFSFPIT